jgi:hypothetical protein
MTRQQDADLMLLEYQATRADHARWNRERKMALFTVTAMRYRPTLEKCLYCGTVFSFPEGEIKH